MLISSVFLVSVLPDVQDPKFVSYILSSFLVIYSSKAQLGLITFSWEKLKSLNLPFSVIHSVTKWCESEYLTTA